MKDQAVKNSSNTMQHRMIAEMIDASFRLSETLGRHPLSKGCNCIHCVNKRKRLLKAPVKDWKYKL